MPVFEKEVVSLEEKSKGKGKWLVLHLAEKTDDGKQRTLNIMNKELADQFRSEGPGKYKVTMEKPDGAEYWSATAAEKSSGMEQGKTAAQAGETAKQDVFKPRPLDAGTKYQNRSITAQVVVKAVADIVAALAGSKMAVLDPAQQGGGSRPLQVHEVGPFAEDLTKALLDKADEFVSKGQDAL